MGLLDQLNEVLLQTPRKYWGDKATRLGSLLGDAASTGAQAYGSANSPMAPEHANTLAGLLADFTPVVGDVKSAYDGMNAAREGDYLGAALGGLGALPLVPNLAGIGTISKMSEWDRILNRQRALEGIQAAMRDPATGKVYSGFSHQGAINKIPPSDTSGAWGRLSSEWDQGTDNTGFLDKAGNFISRAEAEKNWGVMTMEDIRDVMRSKWGQHGR